MKVSEAILLASQAHQAGDLRLAEDLYRKVLAEDPNQLDALNLLGVLSNQAGRGEEGVELIRRAIGVAPTRASFHFNLGVVLADLGRLAEAIAADRQAIALNPDFAAAHNNLGNALADSGSAEEAVGCLRRAMELAPKAADAPYNLGNVLKKLGRMEEAAVAYRRALSLRPQWREALSGLGEALCGSGDFAAGVEVCGRALDLGPQLAEGHNNLGNALCGLGEYEQGIVSYERALAIRPEYADGWNNLGNAYQCTERFDEAITAYERAVALGVDLARWNIGLIHLMKGDYERGWPEYELRLKIRNPQRREFSEPKWDGSELGERRILLHSEQGAGDAIQFFRYVRLVAERGGRIVVVCQPELRRLFAMQNGVEECFDVNAGELPRCDVQLAMGSLPGVFRTIPGEVPYLTAEAAAIGRWRTRVEAAAGRRRRIGLAWAGRRQPDPFRSVPGELLGGLAKAEGNWFCSLQKGELEKKPPGLEMADWTSELTDFAETAALMANLDLVITIDTAVAHLAGAMGKGTWVMLKSAADWRWMIGRGDSPWYPTMRLFRQKRRGDWEGVVGEAAGALEELRPL
jgi:tetratricopeptide (TPR) repeat protein